MHITRRTMRPPESRLLLLFAGLMTFGFLGCGGDAGGAAGPGAGGPRVALVRVGPVVREPVQPVTSAVGTVVALRTSVVASGAEGKVDQFLVRRGQIVEEDQELSILNMVTTEIEIEEAQAVLQEREQQFLESQGSREEEINEALARLEAAQVTRDIASDRLKRWMQLSQSGAAPQDTLDDARERSMAAEKLYAAATASYKLVKSGPREESRMQAKARLDAQRHHIAYLKAERDKRTTRAPFRGMIVAEHTESGQWLSKGAPVVTIADLLENVEIVANVDQRELKNIQLGASVTAFIEGAEPREWTGCISAIIPRSDWERGARTFPAKITVPNKVRQVDGELEPVLREGMLARVIFHGPEHDATLVPKSSLVRSETGTRLYAILPGEAPNTGKARPVVIQEGGAYGDRVEVLGDELQPGMLVVTEGAERLTPFADVSIQSDPPAGGDGPADAGAPAAGSAAGGGTDPEAALDSTPDEPESETKPPPPTGRG